MHIIDYFLHILHPSTNISGPFTEDMFKYSPSVILHDDMLEGFLDEGWGRTKDGIGNGLLKCLLHCDVSLRGFVMK